MPSLMDYGSAMAVTGSPPRAGIPRSHRIPIIFCTAYGTGLRPELLSVPARA